VDVEHNVELTTVLASEPKNILIHVEVVKNCNYKLPKLLFTHSI